MSLFYCTDPIGYTQFKIPSGLFLKYFLTFPFLSSIHVTQTQHIFLAASWVYIHTWSPLCPNLVSLNFEDCYKSLNLALIFFLLLFHHCFLNKNCMPSSLTILLLASLFPHCHTEVDSFVPYFLVIIVSASSGRFSLVLLATSESTFGEWLRSAGASKIHFDLKSHHFLLKHQDLNGLSWFRSL